MKRVVCILVCLYSALMACIGCDPFRAKRGRVAGPRLTDARWDKCCVPAVPERTCAGVNDRDEAQAVLLKAHDDCLDVAFRAVQQHAPDDLSAAYFIRGQRRNDPVDFLRALHAAEETLQRNPQSRAARFNRALAQEKLGLTAEAIASWDEVVEADDSEWGDEAEQRRNALMKIPDPTAQWSSAAVDAALLARDQETLTKMASAFPTDAARHFNSSNLLDIEASRLFAGILRDRGDAYAWDVVVATERTRDRNALERGILALREAREADAYEHAAALLERAENPLSYIARYQVAANRFLDSDPLPILDAIPTSKTHRELSTRVHIMRAAALEQTDRYVEALKAYASALQFAQGDSTLAASILARRSLNYATIGNSQEAFRDAFAALPLLPRVADVNARFHVYESAAMAARELGYPAIAFLYSTASVTVTRNAATNASPRAKGYLAATLRARADAHAGLGREVEAGKDLQEASGLAEAMGNQELLAQLRMRNHEVQGHLFLKDRPVDAVAELTKAIDLAIEQNSTYRANLYFTRATARRKARLPGADEDMAEAFAILRAEATRLLDSRERGEYENLWRPYFSRFQQMQHELVRSLIGAQDVEGAFVYTELARAFEPMHMLLQSQSVPSGFRRIESVSDLRQQRAGLSGDTVILQYVVLDDRTYVWVVTRDAIRLVPLVPGAAKIEGWVNDINAIVQGNQPSKFSDALVPPHEELFRLPLQLPEAVGRKRLVVVPDGPMHGLPFAALHGSPDGPFLAEQYSISVAGSTSLYLYALQRDLQFQHETVPSVLVVGDPAFDPAIGERLNLEPLDHAREEAIQLGRDYAGAEVLLGPAATTRAFLDSAKKATTIHFAGHGVASPYSPWNSMLLCARHGTDSGELTAGRLLREISSLDRTQLVVLAACSSASGQTVGPEGVAPLVRPFIAANVPAVVGTLWDVRDATAKNLMVSLHCHYRNGDDVAVALQKAQLEMLRQRVPAMHWAPFQVTGYAASPYRHHIAMEKTPNDQLCSENSLHRPDGLHSQ